MSPLFHTIGEAAIKKMVTHIRQKSKSSNKKNRPARLWPLFFRTEKVYFWLI